jgi:hypothetical protein
MECLGVIFDPPLLPAAGKTSVVGTVAATSTSSQPPAPKGILLLTCNDIEAAVYTRLGWSKSPSVDVTDDRSFSAKLRKDTNDGDA